MEILAENRFNLTKSLFMEGMAQVSRHSNKKLKKQIALLLLLLWAVMSALLLLIGSSPVQVLIYLVVFLILGFWFNVQMPKNHAKKAWDSLVYRCGENPERATRFYSDHLEIESGESVKSVLYSEISVILQTDRLVVLICQDKMGILVPKSGFILGSPDDIQALVQGVS